MIINDNNAVVGTKIFNKLITKQTIFTGSNKLFFLILIFGFFLFGLGGYFFGYYKGKNLINKTSNESHITEQPLANLNPSPTTSLQSSSGCNVSKNYDYAINNSPTIDNWCEIRMFYEWDNDFGYRLVYPNDWTVNLMGVAGTNLLLEKDNKEQITVTVAHIQQTDFTVENYDKIERGYEQAPPSPIIGAEDKIISKEVIRINNKSVLKVETVFENDKHTYYLIDNGDQKNKVVYAVRVNEAIPPADIEKILKSFTPEFI